MNKNLLIGIPLFFADLWAGSYFFGFISYKDWQSFPLEITCVVIAVSSMALIGIGISQYVEKDE